MRVLFINSFCGTGSTGRICCELADKLSAEGYECKIAYGRSNVVPEKWKHYGVRIGNALGVRCHALSTRIFDNTGFCSKTATRIFLKWADDFDPDILWLHNLHGYYINIELLFEWIKSKQDMEVRWTLHDCWSFTGHCSHFTYVQCKKWETYCRQCIQKKRYPASFVIDSSETNYERKRTAFTGVNNLTIITPSKWLSDLVKKSFLNGYPVEVRYNTIDPQIFKPTSGNFRKRYALEDKKIILGVASTWDARKGLQDMINLRKKIDGSIRIVLVGLSKKQIKRLPDGITGIERIYDPSELAEIYTAADVFVNTSYEENYPTVNLEAEACGTPVVAYDSGGSAETLKMPLSKTVTPGDVEELKRTIMRIINRE